MSDGQRSGRYYYYYYYLSLLLHKVAHREYNIKQQNAKTLKQYDAKTHKRVSAFKIYKYIVGTVLFGAVSK